MALETVEIDNGPRLVSPEPEPEDFDSEASLRPKTLEEYIGQDKAKENLKIYLQAAKMRGEPLDHLLLYGVFPAIYLFFPIHYPYQGTIS